MDVKYSSIYRETRISNLDPSEIPDSSLPAHQLLSYSKGISGLTTDSHCKQ
jgi:hypothetical protein